MPTDAPSVAPADPSAGPVSAVAAQATAQVRGAHWLWPIVGVCVVAWAGLGAYLLDELREGETFRLDRAILLALRHPDNLAHPLGPAWLLQSAIDFSALGGFTLLWSLGGAGLGFLVLLRRRAEAAWIAASVVGASILNATLKVWLHRPRPEIVPHLAVVSNASFPSGHAMISSAVYLTLALMIAEVQPRLGARLYVVGAASLLVLLIGCSRVYLGVHWPSDVLAGWAFGSAWAFSVFIVNRLFTRPGPSPRLATR
jgi:undecaprenyl-diphosphatase